MTAPVLHLSIPVDDLGRARDFYERALGCSVGRVRDDFLDVWFFGMQLTLQHRPSEVAAPKDQGIRHFGVALPDANTYTALVDRLRSHGVPWLSAPASSPNMELSGKVGAKFADPSGNVIEIKYYEDPTGFLGKPAT